MPHIDVHDLGRIRRIATVLARHGFGGLMDGSFGAGSSESPEGAQATAPWAVRLREVVVELGPTFVKMGQVLSVRPDILPAALVNEFQKLQDEVPPVSWLEAKAVLEGELGQPVEEVFRSVNPEPVASASIAQVHLGVRKDGRTIAIKVQRPGIRDIIESDLHILYSTARLLEGRVALPGVYTPVAIVQEFEAAIHQELDFFLEARNGERFGANFREHEKVVVPKIHRDLSGSKVLVMDRLDGRPLSTLRAGDERVESAMDVLLDATLTQVFEHGFFHGDPHPGNLLVQDDGCLAYLDFGLCGTLTPEMRDTIITIFVALVFRDADTVAHTAYRIGAVEGRVDLREFRGEIARLMDKYHGATLKDLSQAASLVEFIEVVTRYRIRLPPEYAVLARAASLVDGILRQLVPDSDIVARVEPHARRLMARQLSPEKLSADALKVLVQAQASLKGLPSQLDQVLTDLERGRLELVTRDPDASRLRRTIAAAGLQTALGTCAAGALITGAILLQAWGPVVGGVPVAGWLGVIFLVGAAVTWATLWVYALITSQLQPGDLRRGAVGVVRFFLGGRRGQERRL
jgi:ubiquinone biosynthesis protein